MLDLIENRKLIGDIRAHYDRLSGYYRAFWGAHIHHGYWEDNESPDAAQVKLIERLAERAAVPRGAAVLDVGCGLGGSAVWLAKRLGCSVTGITISPAQVNMATLRARAEKLGDRLHFEVMDANRLDVPAQKFDVVWVVECSEHLLDKPRFLMDCARALRPGGRLALCAWLAGEHPPESEPARLVAEVCHGMLCPSLGSLVEHVGWLEAAGFEAIEAEDITRRVERTWDRCTAIAGRPEVKALLRVMDGRTREFVNAFQAIRRAYAEGAMAYGMFVATKPR